MAFASRLFSLLLLPLIFLSSLPPAAAALVFQQTQPFSHGSSYPLDDGGRQAAFTDALGHTTSFIYDVLNRRTATTFADGTTTATGYDALGRLIAVTDALSQVTRYSYDELGNELTQKDANQHLTTYRYDGLGRRTSRTLPLGMSESMTYNTVGNLTARTDFNGKTTTYGYDALGRLLTRTPDASLSEPAVTYTYTASGQRATMSDASGVTTYGYDARDRLSSKATPQGTLTYTYDNASSVAGIASNHAQGASTSYSYDALQRLGTVNDTHLGATSYAYDPVGNLQSYALPNGTAHAYTYNTVNRLTSMAVWSTPLAGTPSVLASATYTLAVGGQRLGVVESGPGFLPTNPSGTRQVTYTYDALIRLTQEAITGDPGHNGTVDYTLDPVGNRRTRASSLTGLTNQSFTYDANDRLTTDTYDFNGNTKTGQVTLNATGAETTPSTASDTYDSENRLTARTGPNRVQVLYDGDGNKVRETLNGQTYSYLIDDRNPTGYAQVVEELQNGTLIRTYTYGHDLLAQDQRDGNGTWSATFYGYDGHGSVRLLTNEQGLLTDTYTYDAFGTLLTTTGTTFNRYRYSGEQYDDALGLYYLRARYMNAANGRFWNADSYEGKTRDPQSLHKYLYANADPVNGSDPSGHTTIAETQVSSSISSNIQKDRDKQAVHQYRRAANRNKIADIYIVFSRGGGSGRGSGRRFGHAFILANFPARNTGFRYDVNPSEDSVVDWLTSGPWKKYTGVFEGALTVEPTTMAEATKKAYGMLKVASHNFGQFAVWNVTATAIAMGPDPLQYRMSSIPGLSDTLSCYSWAIQAATSAFFLQYLPAGG